MKYIFTCILKYSLFPFLELINFLSSDCLKAYFAYCMSQVSVGSAISSSDTIGHSKQEHNSSKPSAYFIFEK